MMTSAPAIEIRDLSKRYGALVAVGGLDLEVERGAFFALLGPNGAGKTTTVSILATLVKPSGGSARLLGHDVVTEAAAVRREIGIVFQETALDSELSAREHLDLHARLYHLSDRPRRVAEALELVRLAGDADRPVRGFSGGMKRRLEIARGLLHQPRVLFLDEPTLGLDVAARASIWRHLRQLHEAGDRTIFLTTHSMEEADSLCERVAILDAGQLVADGSPEALKSALGGDVVVLTLGRPDGAEDALRCVDGVARVRRDNGLEGHTRLRITVAEGPRRLPALLDAARPFDVIEVALQRPTLDHVFLHHTGHAFEADAPEGRP
jgi:ABC-2 type transport system ATP-binding protein